MPPRTLATAAFLCSLLVFGGCAAHTDADVWPDKTVSSDRLRLAGPVQLKMPRRNLNDPMPNGTAVVRLDVDERGKVRKALLVGSSGNSVLDSAATQALVGARFVPYREDGVAIAVTTLMPMSVKGSAQCRGLSPLDC